MKNIAFLFILFSSLVSHAQENYQTKILATMAEKTRLVSAESLTREYLSCAVLSLHLNNLDMYGLFARKTLEATSDVDAFPLALAHMSGFFESEILHLQGKTSTSKEVGMVMGQLYVTKCMKYVAPQKR